MMRILVDTSVWVHHFRQGDRRLISILESESVLTHPFVKGELYLGNMQKNSDPAQLIELLEEGPVASHGEVLNLLSLRNLSGRGVGWVDVHLAASALISGSRLYTRDGKLNQAIVEAMPELELK